MSAEMFTIEVKKKEGDKDFTYKELELSHLGCGGGKIEASEHREASGQIDYFFGKIDLRCKRCTKTFYLYADGIAEISKTAIDGKEREIKSEGVSLRIVQKKLT